MAGPRDGRHSDRPVIGFEVDAHSSGIRFNARGSDYEERLSLYFNAAKVSEAENDRLRAALHEERERVSLDSMHDEVISLPFCITCIQCFPRSCTLKTWLDVLFKPSCKIKMPGMPGDEALGRFRCRQQGQKCGTPSLYMP